MMSDGHCCPFGISFSSGTGKSAHLTGTICRPLTLAIGLSKIITNVFVIVNYRVLSCFLFLNHQ